MWVHAVEFPFEGCLSKPKDPLVNPGVADQPMAVVPTHRGGVHPSLNLEGKHPVHATWMLDTCMTRSTALSFITSHCCMIS